MGFMSDIEIAQSVKPKKITEIAKIAGVDEKYLELYGNYKAKVDYQLLRETDRKDGKLILVTAITPTPAGEGKTTTSIGLADGLARIGKDVTVVSRAISNKYVQMPWGVKALKSFFSEDINGASRHEVYDDLKKLIENEDRKHPLSDDALCEQLKAMGYRLERRTVAKYREALKIPSSTIRRKMQR